MARDMMLTPDEYMSLMRLISSEREAEGSSLSERRRDESQPAPKRRRKVSKYNKEFGKQFEKLKKAHPRTEPKRLMSRAHTATRAKLGMPRKRRA